MKTMKKVVALLLAVMMLMTTFTGCADNSD